MQNVIRVSICLFLVTVAVIACAPEPSPTPHPATPVPTREAPKLVVPVKPDWEREWDKTLQAAKGEGRVTVYYTAPPSGRMALAAAFKKNFGVSVEYVVGRSSELAEKLFRERRASLFVADVFQSGSYTQTTVLKPSGAYDTLDGVLIRPDVLDPSLWWGG